MAIRKDLIEIEGEEEILDLGYMAIAKQNGWKEEILNEQFDLITNPISPKDFALDITKKFWRETITAYNIKQAQEQAKEMAKSATHSALDMIIIKEKLNE